MYIPRVVYSLVYPEVYIPRWCIAWYTLRYIPGWCIARCTYPGWCIPSCICPYHTLGGVYLSVYVPPIPPWVYHRLSASPGATSAQRGVSGVEALGSDREKPVGRRALLPLGPRECDGYAGDDAHGCSALPGVKRETIG